MHEPTTPTDAASTAAEAVRALNHLTMAGADLAELYAVIGQLQLLAERLPQTFDQLADVLERPSLGIEYGVDNDAEPDEVIGDAVIAMRAAADRAHDLARRLADAQSAVGHLYIARELTSVDEPGE